MGYDPELLDSVEQVNKTQPLKAVEFCREQLGSLRGKKIAILGLAFKPDTDDMREARVIPIINQLLKEGANVVAYDPVATPVAKAIFGDRISYASTALECIKGSDACIIVTEWEEFKKLTPDDYVKNMKQPVLIDGRRIYKPEIYAAKLHFTAIGLGKDVRMINPFCRELPKLFSQLRLVTHKQNTLTNQNCYIIMYIKLYKQEPTDLKPSLHQTN